MENIFVILPPPCTNSDLHMGHLTGVYIPGDIYSRYMLSSGYSSLLVCGADQNNTYTEKKSELLNEKLINTQSHFAKKIHCSLKATDIIPDIFVHTNSPQHIDMAKSIMDRLVKNGFAGAEERSQLYCKKCAEYIFDNRAKGFCGNCGYVSDAGICENCNNPIFNSRLREAIHDVCGSTTILKKTNVFTLKLDKLKDILINYISNSIWDVRIKNKYLEYLSKDHIENPPITYHYKNGIKFDSDLIDGKYLTIWFEAIWSLFTSISIKYNVNLDGVIEKLNSDTCLVPFMGQDTEFYYAIGIPAVMLGLGINNIPKNFSVQRFVKFDEKKFSSSRNHVISIHDLLKKYSVDVIRFYSISILTHYFKDNNNFSLNELEKFSIDFEKFKIELYEHSKKNINIVKKSIIENEFKKILDAYHESAKILDFNSMINATNKISNIILQRKDKETMQVEIALWLIMMKPIMPNITKTICADLFSTQWREIYFSSTLPELLEFNYITNSDEM